MSQAERRNTAKLLLHWKGPYRVAEFLTPVKVRLTLPDMDDYVTRARFVAQAWSELIVNGQQQMYVFQCYEPSNEIVKSIEVIPNCLYT
jgi:hypothetical protein